MLSCSPISISQLNSFFLILHSTGDGLRWDEASTERFSKFKVR